MLVFNYSNTSRGKRRVPDTIAHEFELVVSELVESRGHNFVVFMRAVRARFNNPGNYFSVSKDNFIVASRFKFLLSLLRICVTSGRSGWPKRTTASRP